MYSKLQIHGNSGERGLVSDHLVDSNLKRCPRNSKILFLIYRRLLVAGIFFLSFTGLHSVAHSETYYLSPSGSNADAGTSAVPWKTFSFTIPKLQPGDTLILKDGTYDVSNSGYPNINCGSRGGAQNGTRTSPITIKAEHERRAFISGTGASPALTILNCSHWKVEGLHARSRDNQNFSGAGGHVFYIKNSTNLTFNRLLLHHNNRYGNTHLLLVFKSNNILVEESEFYSFHRHPVIFAHTDNSVARRTYANSRGHADIPGGWPSTAKTRGQAGFIVYPGSNNIGENNISEGQRSGVSISAAGTTIGNRLLGNISLNDLYGVHLMARGEGIERMPRSHMIENAVVIQAAFGIWARSSKDTRVKNASVFDGKNSGVIADVAANPGDGIYSFFSENLLVINNAVGINIKDQTTWSHNYPNVFNNRTHFSPSTNVTNATTLNPEFGACRVFVPDNSPLKGKGAGGVDIGANILYRYENGVLTNQPLWNPQTGAFPGGAIVAGINDIPGSSLFDVHKRLNVNANGCKFPENYGGGNSDMSPQFLRVITSR